MNGLNLGGAQHDHEGEDCPDCGEPMELQFAVQANSEELARKVAASYFALKAFPIEAIVKAIEGKLHVHFAEGSAEDCPESTKGEEDDG